MAENLPMVFVVTPTRTIGWVCEAKMESADVIRVYRESSRVRLGHWDGVY
jgi:hypothetical protein